MNLNPYPKSEFVKDSTRVKRHRDMFMDDALRESVNAALLEMSRQLTASVPPDMGGCAAAYLRMQGASDFVNILFNLAETPAAPTKSDSTNLPGNVRK